MPLKDPEKRKAYHKAYREANKEVRKAYDRAYREANKEKKKALNKAYRAANPEKIKALKKVYHEANKEKAKAYCEANKEKISAVKKAYRKAHKEEHCAMQAKRRALKKQAILPTTDFELIKNIYKQREAATKEHGEQYQVDHIIPLTIGGAHHQDNLRIITAKENNEKGFNYIPELGGVWADNDLARETKRNHANEATKQIR
jgi:5-methylcytosine-specific restriction endonuclease McrA